MVVSSKKEKRKKKMMVRSTIKDYVGRKDTFKQKLLKKKDTYMNIA